MIFGFRPKNLKIKAVAVALSIAWLEDDVEPPAADDRARDRLAAFRRDLYQCLTRRADELAELADAVLCAGGPVRVLAELSREEQRADDPGLAVLVRGRAGARPHVLDRGAGRGAPGPADDLAAVTAAQVREVIGRIIAAGHWRDGDPDILVIFDAGYEPARLAWLLKDLPVQVLGRLGSNRVLHQPPPPREPGQMGRPLRHGPGLRLATQAARPAPDVTTTTQTSRYGAAAARAWHRTHPRLHARGAWAGHDGELPIIEGTLIQLTVDHLPHERHPKPVWPWTSGPAAGASEVDRCWQAFLRRFDIEHTFRFLKQALGWTAPKLRDPAAAGRWTWLILAAHAQLRLARPLAEDLRPPWQRPAPAGRCTPARVRRGFRNIHATLPSLTAAPKPGKPGPGRPPGSKNRHPATRHDVGKNTRNKKPKKPRPARQVK
jgi:hypothetical protein